MQRYGLGVVVGWWLLLGLALTAEPQQLSPGETVRVGRQYFVRYCSFLYLDLEVKNCPVVKSPITPCLTVCAFFYLAHAKL